MLQGEHATETELKLRILEIYNAKLDEREVRKSFVIERGLLDYKRLLSMERKRPREEREVYEAFRPFARFNTPAEHEDLVRGIILEQRLRKRIAQLQEYRRNGIRSLAEAQEYEAARRKREQQAALRRAGASAYTALSGGASGSARVGAADAGGAGGVGVGASGRRIKGTAATLASGGTLSAAAMAAASGGMSSAFPFPSDSESTPTASGASSTAAASSSAAAAAADGSDGTGDLDAILKDKKRLKGGAITGGSSGAGGAAASSSSGGAGAAAAAAAPFTVVGLPGSERLNAEERGLCEHLRLIPLQYQQIKATILNLAHVRNGVRRAEAVAKLPHVDVSKIGGVYDFVVSAGWANPRVDADA